MTVSVVAAALVVVLAVTHAPHAGAVALGLAGALPLAAAALLWPVPALRGRPVPAFRRWFAAGLAVWGAGQLLNLVTVGPGGGPERTYPAPGDVVSLTAAPLAVAGLVLFARAVPGLTGVALPAARLFIDAMLLGLSLALVVWRFWVQGTVPAGAAATAVVVLTLLADLVVGCMGGLLALRRPARPVLVAAAGLGLAVAGHVLVLQRALEPSVGWTAAGAALLVAGWPLVTVGVLGHRVPAVGDDDGDVAAEARLTAVTTTGTVVVLGVGVLGVLLRPPVDRVSLSLVLVLIVVVWVREMIATGQRSSLLRRLHAEATLDPLTGLANRRQLTHRLATVDPAAQTWCLLTLDLDAFKTVNDVLGHEAGDRLLQAVGAAAGRGRARPGAWWRGSAATSSRCSCPAPAEAQRLGEAWSPRCGGPAATSPGWTGSGCRPASGSPPSRRSAGPGRRCERSRARPAVGAVRRGAAQQLAKAAGRDRVQLYDAGAATLAPPPADGRGAAAGGDRRG